MADLNKIKISIQNESKKVEDSLKKFYSNYEILYREVNRQYLTERTASPREDYRDFFRLLQTIKRNKDLTASLLRGFSNMRPLYGFRFIEEANLKTPVKHVPVKKAQTPNVPEQDTLSSDFIIEPEVIEKEDNNG
jgi:hypothetical protein